MKHLTLTRAFQSDEATLGMMKVGDKPLYTLELPWMGNQRRISCIPAGVYVCKPYSSQKFPGVYELQDVPDRSKILIHVGNRTKDVLGCIVVGMGAGYMDTDHAVFQSRAAMAYFKSFIGDEDFTLTIKE